MVFDFSKTCNTYDANAYNENGFATSHCPECKATGNFNLHGSYKRHVLYLDNFNNSGNPEFIHKHMEIKRIKCLSCKTTHAVMPGDIIPYKALSLFSFIHILGMLCLEKAPVLKAAEKTGFSFQFIYGILSAFRRHAAGIYQHFREAASGPVPPGLDSAGIFALIRKPFILFQSNYIKSTKRPCFMCKFFYSNKAPPVGVLAPVLPPGGQ